MQYELEELIAFHNINIVGYNGVLANDIKVFTEAVNLGEKNAEYKKLLLYLVSEGVTNGLKDIPNGILRDYVIGTLEEDKTFVELLCSTENKERYKIIIIMCNAIIAERRNTVDVDDSTNEDTTFWLTEAEIARRLAWKNRIRNTFETVALVHASQNGDRATRQNVTRSEVRVHPRTRNAANSNQDLDEIMVVSELSTTNQDENMNNNAAGISLPHIPGEYIRTLNMLSPTSRSHPNTLSQFDYNREKKPEFEN